MKNILKLAVIIGVVISLFALPLFSRNAEKGNYTENEKRNINKERDSFYRKAGSKLKFKKDQVESVRNAGFSPMASYMYISLAKRAKQPVEAIIKDRDEGLSLKEICDKYGINYEKFYMKTKNTARKKKIRFPSPTASEKNRDATNARRKGGAGR